MKGFLINLKKPHMDPDEILALLKSLGVFLPALDFSPGGAWLSRVGMNTISMLEEADRKALQDTKVISPLPFQCLYSKIGDFLP